MAVGTVRGRFELDAPALRTLRDLERQGIRTQKQMKELGDQMDRVGGLDDARRIREYGQATADLRRTTERSHRSIREEWSRTTRHIRLEVIRQQRAIRDLEGSLTRLAARTARPTIRLSGTAESMGEIAAAQSALGVLGTRTARPSIRTGGGGGGDGGIPRPPRVGSMPRVTGGGGGRGGGGLLDFGNIGLRPRNAAMLAALGYAPQLLGAGGALAGSAGMGALGAGATGLAGGLGLIAGVGGTMLAGRTMVKPIQEAQKAVEKYTEAVRDFGRASNQARTAKRELDQAMAAAPRGTRDLLRETRGLGREYARGVAPGRDALMGTALNAVRRTRGFLNEGGYDQINRVSRASGRSGTRFTNFLTGRTGQRAARVGAGIYSANLPNVERSVESGLGAALNIAQASRPFLREMTDAIRRWTKGWADSTSNIERTRGKIREMVDHLKSWWRLTRTAGGLVGSLLGAGAGSGRNMVDDATRKLREWQAWIDRNPRKVREFFRNAVSSTEKLAGGLAAIGTSVWNIAQALRPVLDRFGQLVTLLGGAGLLTPGAGALAFGAFRGLRGGRGGGGGAGGGLGLLGLGGGGGGGRGAAGAAARRAGAGVAATGRATQGTYQVARAVGYNPALAAGAAGITLGGRAATGAARVAGVAARGAGRAFWPIGLGMAALDFAGTPGNFGQRTQAAVSGATLGLIPRPVLGAEHVDRGTNRAREFLGNLSQNTHLPNQREQMRQIEAQIARNRRRAAHTTTIRGGGTEGGGAGYTRTASDVTAGEQKELAAQNKELRAGLAERKAVYRDYVRDVHRIMDERSRRRATGVWEDLLQGNAKVTKQRGAQAGARRTVSATLDEMRTMGRAGKRQIAQNALDWAREAKRKNPALAGEYDRLVRGVERQFNRLHKNVKVINGRILDGSQAQWSSIADQISSAARRGVDETSKEFDRLKRKAVTSLKLMGFSDKEANDLFRYMGKGGATASRARRAAANPSLYKNAPAFKAAPGDAATGDGLGRKGIGGPAPEDRAGRAGAQAQTAQAAQGGVGLMGANPNLMPYAQLGASMGLHVSSGARPGSITSSGNVSWHSSGHAIDVAGPPGRMLEFFHAMKSQYGPGLEELIHTPGGQGIKNGQPYTYTGQVAADHFDHVHVADKDPTGVAGGPTGAMFGAGGAPGGISLAARQSGLGGVPGALSSRAMGGLALGMEQAVNAAIGAGGAVPGGGGAVGPGRGGKYDMASLAQLWIAAGGPPGVANLMASIAMAESGGNPGIGNAGRTPNGTTVAAGLWQILGLPFPGDPTDPMTNAKMAVAKYKAAGGTSPWNASKAQWGRRAAFAAGGAAGDGHGRSGGGARRFSSSPRSRSVARRAARGAASVGGGVTVHVNGPFHVRSERDIDAIANAVGSKLLAVLGGDAVPDGALA